MIDGKATDFIEKLSYEDHYVIFRNDKYFVNGCCVKIDNDNKKEVMLSVYEINENDSIRSVILEIRKPTISECLSDFESAPIWGGKTFWEIESELEWVDC